MKTLVIEDGVTKIQDEEFKGCDYEEIIVPDSVKEIGIQAFQKCKRLKKITLSKNLKILGDAALAQCSNLESVEIPESLTYLPSTCFANCTQLKSIKLHDKIDYIDHYALYKCKNLENFNIPSKLRYLGVKALAQCNKIKSITIPASLTDIECAALSEMRSLKEIKVENGNPCYNSFDGKSLINIKDNIFIQYAIAAHDLEYTVYNFPVYFSDVPSLERIYHIADYAFAGARNLKQLNITGAVESLGSNTFKNMNCPNLKILIDSYSDNIIYNMGKFNGRNPIPFKNIELEEGITYLSDNLNELFKNAITVKLPSTLVQIGTNVFSDSKCLKELTLSKNIKSIEPETFADGILLHFEGFKDIKSEDFLTLQTKSSDEAYLTYFDKNNTRIFSLRDGSYYVKMVDYGYIPISKEEIREFSNNSEMVENDPDLFLQHFFKLSYFYVNYSMAFFNIFNNKEIYKAFEMLLGNLDNIKEMTEHRLKEIISRILKDNNHFDELLLNGLLMRNVSKDDLLLLLENMNPSLERFLKQTDYLKSFSSRSFLSHEYYDLNYIINYCKLLDDYGIKDTILFNDNIAVRLPYEDQKLLVKHFNKNIKRLLLKSKTLETISITDLVNLMKIMGVFSSDLVLSQKVTTFLIEKIVDEQRDYKIIGDNIHRVFNELKVRNAVDYEFVRFFIDNYQELLSYEKSNSGFIARIYNNFEEIKKLSTSNHGNQRRIRVTLDKCLYYFLIKTFRNVNENNKKLAFFLNKFYFEDGILVKAEEILAEADKALRNIFTSSKDPNDDIKGCIKDFTYEWLPKQDWYNLVLGKYCNCCAHIYGNGAGIMLASMVDDNVQNFVVRAPNDVIIAKGTLYVNRNKGYGIINTIEVESHINDVVKEEIIYPAFIQGVKKFVEIYNQNNSIPLDKITIGTNQNALLNILIANNCQDTELLQPINYSDYKYSIDGHECGAYNGDAFERQLLLYKK